ncbi:MAG TPA: restriction endonuclease [Verrucomicrobiota bacterium]|nr:restriction endonuclease [Verrucomicrobiota bacterium]
MAVPDFQSLMRPLLECVSDGGAHSIPECQQAISQSLRLRPEDVSQMLPSGRQSLLANRLHWAKTHLRMAGLVESTGRGVFRITERGRMLLESHPGRIDLRVLRLQPGYEEARGPRRDRSPANGATADEEATQTPEEVLEEAHQRLRTSLADELLARLKSASPSFFERVVVELLVRMGYGGSRRDAGRAIGRSGDEGIDGIIKEDRLGLDTICLQAKRWENTGGRPEIQKFAGALQGFRARKGIFITTADFSVEAREYAGRIDSKIVLIDGRQLCSLMLDFGIGVSTVATYEVKKVDNDYFDEAS